MLNKLSFNLAKELNESETRKFKIKKKVFMESTGVKVEELEPNKKDSNKLTEGAGAGYNVDGTIVNPVVNSFKIINDETDKYGYHSYELECDIDAEITDVKAYSYYDGGNIDGNISVKITGLSINQEKDEYELTNEEIRDSIDGASFKSKHGGGWSHVTFSGSLGADLDSNYYGAYYSSNATITIKSQDVITGIDQLVQGVDYAYGVLDENNDLIDGYYDNEDEAIKYAKETEEAYYVVEYYMYITGASVYNDGDNQYLDIDQDYDDYKVIWSKDNDMEESEKPLKEGFKLGEKAEIIDTCERRGQPVALVNLSKAKGWDEYVVAFGYTTENDEVSWNYGYYYYDEESAKEAFEKVKAGGNLSESEEHNLSKDLFGAEAEKRLSQEQKDLQKDLQYVRDIMAGKEVIDDKYHEKLSLDTAKKWLRKDFVNVNCLASANPDDIDKKLAQEYPDIFGNELDEAVETEVKDLQVIKEQGNIYMLEDKSEGTRYIVGENYNLSEGEIENAEIYDNKEEADKDYLDRCEITTTKESDQPLEDTNEPVEESVIGDLKANHYMKKATKEASKGNAKKAMKSMIKANKITDKSIDKLNKKIDKLNNKAENLKNKANDSMAKVTKVYDDNFNAKK